MKRAAAALVAALTIGVGTGEGVRAQADRIALLLRRLEQVAQTGDSAGHSALLAASMNRDRAAAFGRSEFPPGLTRVVIRERDRQPLAGTQPGRGYRLLVEAFEQSGDRARVATWLLDVIPAESPGTDEEWLIADERRLTSVENLYRLSLNPSKQLAARNLTIVSDDLELTLVDGFAFVADTDLGVAALVLVGRGEMKFHPAPESEKGQVRIFGGADTLDVTFDTAYLRMHPADLSALIATKRLLPTAVDPREFRRADRVFRLESAKSFGAELGDLSPDAWWFLPRSGDVLAEIHTRRFDTLTYARTARGAEDISLFDRKNRHQIALYASERKLKERGPSYDEDDLAEYDVLHYDIDVDAAPDRQWIDGRATLRLKVRAPSVNTLTMRLAASLGVQSVVSAEYGPLFGMRVKNQDLLVVNLPASFLRDTEMSVTVTYAGRLEPQPPDRETQIARQAAPALPTTVAEPHALYSTGTDWYPKPEAPDYATATLNITVPADLHCVASGDLAEGSPAPAGAANSPQPRKLYAFTATQPLRYLAFVVSRFVHVGRRTVAFAPGGQAADDGIEGVWYRTLDVAVEANRRQTGRGRDLVERTAAIAAFYQSIVGDAPYSSFTVAVVDGDLPGGHSPGYFAVLRQPVSGSPSVWLNDPAAFQGYPDFFIAHELAHQWWGQAVGGRNYHEQWLSEGFSEYFAALYAEHQLGSDVFADVIRKMRRSALDESDQGPIALGYRLGHIRGEGRVFRALVYNKSAIVLHMLRRLAGDDAFFRGVRRFYLASRFQKVGTEEFRAAIEAEADRSFERFFDRWILGSRLPRMKFSYRVDGPDVVLHAEQLDEVFDFPLTVTLQYADRKPVDIVFPVTDRVVDLRVPLAGALRRAEIGKNDAAPVIIEKN